MSKSVTEETPLFVGCCGWSQAKNKYFDDFSAVELQSTFYEPPSAALAEKWRALAPSSFRFCLKAWQLITHTPASPTYRRLKSKLSAAESELVGSFRQTEQVWLAWERTESIARILEAKVILFQCPGSFRPEKENVANLRAFFSQIKRGDFQMAWEPRGEWPVELVQELCTELNLIHCVDPLKVDHAAYNGKSFASRIYWRLHGRSGYSYRYADEDLAEVRGLLQQRTTPASGAAYVFFNNIWMKQDALRFRDLIERGKTNEQSGLEKFTPGE